MEGVSDDYQVYTYDDKEREKKHNTNKLFDDNISVQKAIYNDCVSGKEVKLMNVGNKNIITNNGIDLMTLFTIMVVYSLLVMYLIGMNKIDLESRLLEIDWKQHNETNNDIKLLSRKLEEMKNVIRDINQVGSQLKKISEKQIKINNNLIQLSSQTFDKQFYTLSPGKHLEFTISNTDNSFIFKINNNIITDISFVKGDKEATKVLLIKGDHFEHDLSKVVIKNLNPHNILIMIINLKE